MTQRTVTPTGADAIVVRPATIERFDDIGAVINRVCWCQWWRITAGEYERSSSSSSIRRRTGTGDA